jgi:hypothetical protein
MALHQRILQHPQFPQNAANFQLQNDLYRLPIQVQSQQDALENFRWDTLNKLDSTCAIIRELFGELDILRSQIQKFNPENPQWPLQRERDMNSDDEDSY